MQHRQIAVFNLDGSVCNDVWRRSFLKEDEQPSALSEYHQKAMYDQPAKGIKARLAELRRRGINIVFITGRPLAYWDATTQWFATNFGYEIKRDYELFMRPSTEYPASVIGNLPDVDMKQYLLRVLKSRPRTEIFGVYDCSALVLRMVRGEKLPAFILDCEEGVINPNENKEPDNAFRVAAQDFALKVTGMRSAQIPGATGFFAVDLGHLAPVKGKASSEDRNEVQDHWMETANATIKANQTISHEARLNSAYYAGETENRPDSALPRVTPNIRKMVDSISGLHDQSERTSGVTPKEFFDYWADIPREYKTAQEACREAADSAPWADSQKNHEGPLSDALKRVNAVLSDSGDVGDLMDYFFPDGLRMRNQTDYQFTSLLMTAFYALNQFVTTGMNDKKRLEQVVLHFSTLESLVDHHTLASSN